MIQLLRIAYRDLGRNKRRSFFSSLALGVGLGCLLLMASVMNGEIRDSMKATIELESGHLQVRAKTYEEAKTSLAWEDLVENPAAVSAQIASLSPVKVATPRLFASGIVVSGDNTAGVRIIGIDPDSPANAPYQQGLIAGQFLTSADRDGLLIGKKLADDFGLAAGSTMNLMVNTSNGAVDQQPFTVRGIFNTGIPSYDESTVFLPLAKAQAFTQAGDHASTIFVLLNDQNQTEAVASALKTSQYEVKDWRQMSEMLITLENMANSFIYVLYLIVLAITATVIVNTLIMSVFERTREIGILAAIGMKGGRILTMFFAESALLALGGILLGWVIGGAMIWGFSRYGIYIGDMGLTGMLFGDRIYAQFQVNDLIVLSIIALLVTLAGSLYPALLAARMEPVQAMHGGGQA